MQGGRRDSVLAALNHQEADRIPIDLEGTHITGISTEAYERLKKYLGIEGKTILADRLSSVQNIQNEVPSENIFTMFDAALE